MTRFWSLRGEQSLYVPYARAQELQRELVEMRARDEIPDTVLFLEHEPVITRGRGLQYTGASDRPRHMPLPELPAGIAFAESERGGDLTYHGPGQLVIYPICKLDGRGFGPERDVAGFLRKLEGLLIAELDEIFAEAGQSARCEGVENATGVWVRGSAGLPSKKIASIGIAVRKWVTYHGAALNCVNELGPFGLISPCGFSPDVMTRIQDWAPGAVAGDWRETLERRLVLSWPGGDAAPADYERFPIPSSERNSLRVLSSSRKAPCMELVIV